MLRKIVVTIMIIIGYLLQTTLLRSITIAGIVPNILLILTYAFVFMRGKNEGMYIGFVSGLLIDIFFGKIIGFYALVYMFIGFVNGFFRRIFYPEDIKLTMILIGLSDLLYCFLCNIFMFLLRGKMHLLYYFVHIMLPEVVYTVLVTLIISKAILYTDVWLEEHEFLWWSRNFCLLSDIKEWIKNLIFSRLFLLVIVLGVLFFFLIQKLFILQIINGKD